MSLKKKNFDIIVVGTGLSSLSFIDSYLEKNNKINVISPNFNKNNFFENKYLNSHIDKYLPPQMIKKLKEVKKYFFYNKIFVNKNCKIFGSLEFGGLSNYWGLQIDQNISDDIEYLNYSIRKKIKKSFIKIFQKFSLLGKINLNNRVYKKDYKVGYFLEQILKKKNHNFNITKPILAYSKKNLNLNENINLELVNERTDELTPKNYYNHFLKKKKIIIHNFVVNKIYKKKNKLFLICENRKKKVIFVTKKLVLGCGTIVTTKLILDFLNIKREVKIKHHPRLFCLFLSKYRYENNMLFMPSPVNIRDSKNSNTYVMDFRPGNKFIINAMINFKKYLLPFKFILNFFRKNMIFCNIFLHSKYSNLFMKLKKNSKVIIFSKEKEIIPTFKKIHKKIFKFLTKDKLILPFFYNYFPGFGGDFHYFGTIPITKKNKELSVNDKCQLKKFKNIYIVDGSVLDFKTNKYPLGLIMANARRIGKEVK